MPSWTSSIHLSVGTPALRCMVLAEALTRAQCRSRSGATPSNTRAPSNTEEPSQIAWVRTFNRGTFPSCNLPSKNVQVCDQSAIEELHSNRCPDHSGKTSPWDRDCRDNGDRGP